MPWVKINIHVNLPLKQLNIRKNSENWQKAAQFLSDTPYEPESFYYEPREKARLGSPRSSNFPEGLFGTLKIATRNEVSKQFMTYQAEGESPLFPPEDRITIISVACQSPEKYGLLGQTHWSISSLQHVLTKNGFFKQISWTTIQRCLSAGEIKPHQMEYYLFCEDSELIKKAREICSIYLNPPKDRIVLCYDERSGTQALERSITTPMGPGKLMRQDFGYKRHGVLDLLAVFDIKSGRVFGDCFSRHRSREVLRFLKRVARKYRGKKITFIMDNLRTHKTEEIISWVESHKGRIEIIYTPKHASWLNQIELWFRSLNQKCLKRLSVKSVQELEQKIKKWIRTYNKHFAHPYNWHSKGILTGLKIAA